MKRSIITAAVGLVLSGAIVTPALAADSESTTSGAIQPRATHECDSVIGKLLQNNQSTSVPAYAGSIACWLDLDVVNYNSATFVLQYYGLNRGEGWHGIVADGYYGPDTQYAMMQTQKRYPALVADGVYGNLTGGMMKWGDYYGAISRWK